MKRVDGLIAALAAAGVVLLATLTTIQAYEALTKPAFVSAGLERVPAADYVNEYPGRPFVIRCEAWSNEPERNFNEEPDGTWIGVRYVRDCVMELAP